MRTYTRAILGVFVTAMLALNLSAGAQAQKARKPRKSIPESKLELPEYFGLYAVLESGEMQVLENTVESLYEIPTLALPANVEFLVYAKERELERRSINLLMLPAVKGQEEARTSLKSSQDFIANAFEGPAKSEAIERKVPIGSKNLKVLVKPVSSQKQMLRLIPSGFLPNGIYQVGSGSEWVRFVVGKIPPDWKRSTEEIAAKTGQSHASQDGTETEAQGQDSHIDKTVTILKGEDNLTEFVLAARSRLDFKLSVNHNEVRVILLNEDGYAEWQKLEYKTAFLGRTKKNTETITGPCPALLKKDVQVSDSGGCVLGPGRYYIVFYDGSQGYKEDINQVGFPVKLQVTIRPEAAAPKRR